MTEDKIITRESIRTRITIIETTTIGRVIIIIMIDSIKIINVCMLL